MSVCRAVLAAVLLSAVCAGVAGQPAYQRLRFSVDPLSPEAGPATIFKPGPNVAVSPATLGLLATDNIDALSDGADSMLASYPPPVRGGGKMAFSVTRGSAGVAGAITREVAGNGAAGDRFRTFVRGGTGAAAVRLSRDATALGLTPLPGESELDALEKTRPRARVPYFFSVDPPTAARLTAALGVPVTAATVLLSYGDGTAPWVFATPAALGLSPLADIDALCIQYTRRITRTSTYAAGRDRVFYSLVGSAALIGAGGGPVIPPAAFGLAASDDLDACNCRQLARRPCVGGRALGQRSGWQLDVGAATGNPNAIGVARTALGGQERVWLTATRVAAGQPHQLYELDRAGNLLASFDQPAATATSSEGLRDLAFDGDYLYAGMEGSRIFAFDVAQRRWQPNADIVIQGGGPAVVRGLAYDGRDHLLWAADSDGTLYGVDEDGVLQLTYPAVGAGTQALAFDAIDEAVYLFDGAGIARSNTQAVGRVFDLEREVRSGVEFYGDLALGGTASGMDAWLAADDTLQLLCLVRAPHAVVYELSGEFSCGITCPGGAGEEAAIAMDGAPFVGNPAWRVTLHDAEGASAAVLAVGFDNARTRGLPLPIDLGLLGLTFCAMETSWDLTLPAVPVLGGRAAASLPIPPRASLAGTPLWLQWIVLDPNVETPLKATVSLPAGTVIHP